MFRLSFYLAFLNHNFDTVFRASKRHNTDCMGHQIMGRRSCMDGGCESYMDGGVNFIWKAVVNLIWMAVSILYGWRLSILYGWRLSI